MDNIAYIRFIYAHSEGNCCTYNLEEITLCYAELRKSLVQYSAPKIGMLSGLWNYAEQKVSIGTLQDKYRIVEVSLFFF